MCGIAGVFGLESRPEVMVDRLRRRGPDASGVFSAGHSGWSIGHARLSILDLSSASDQPFHSACGRYVAVYNGEVYNFRELANKHALSLRTRSDTEVVIELFARLGPDFVKELNGMFALAVLDRDKGALFLYRDRLGIKPLYLYRKGESAAFASELPALLAGLPPHAQDSEALGLFLHRGYIPEPRTWYRDIEKFPAGHYAEFRGGEVKYTRYWSAEEAVEAGCHSSEAAVLDRLHELVRDSVRLRMVSDVPFGTFLSGGADSGLITALAADQHDGPIDTFNVSFEDAPFDETPYARRMAQIVGSRHHHIRVTREEVMDSLSEGMSLVGEPFADSSVFPTMAVSKFAAGHVKMALSGDGGDELFHGYGAYAWAERMAKPHMWGGRKAIAAALRFKGGNRNRRAANVFDAPDKAGLAAHIFSQEQNLFTAKEITALTGNTFRDPYTPPDLARKLTPAEAQAFFDMTNYLKDDLLVKVDRSSMRHGLEVRVPFLDHRLVEYALNIDPALKFKNGEAKYPVKKIMEKYYPKELIYRKKWGFSVPLEKWMTSYRFKDESARMQKKAAAEFNELRSNYDRDGYAFLYNRIYAMTVATRFQF